MIKINKNTILPLLNVLILIISIFYFNEFNFLDISEYINLINSNYEIISSQKVLLHFGHLVTFPYYLISESSQQLFNFALFALFNLLFLNYKYKLLVNKNTLICYLSLNLVLLTILVTNNYIYPYCLLFTFIMVFDIGNKLLKNLLHTVIFLLAPFGTTFVNFYYNYKLFLKIFTILIISFVLTFNGLVYLGANLNKFLLINYIAQLISLFVVLFLKRIKTANNVFLLNDISIIIITNILGYLIFQDIYLLLFLNSLSSMTNSVGSHPND